MENSEFECDLMGVARNLGVTYLVALDNDLKIWQAFNNKFRPTHYFIDAQALHYVPT
jgi:hypothetical protein